MANETPEENRLESCIEDGVTEWLEFNGFTYNLSHMNTLIRRLSSVLDVHSRPEQLKDLIQSEVTPWREEHEMNCTLTDYNNLIRDLEDRLSALQQRIITDEDMRRAS